MHEDKVIHVQTTKEMLAGYAFVTEGYARRVAFGLVGKALAAFRRQVGDWRALGEGNLPAPEVAALFEQYRDPARADKLTEAGQKLDETKIVLRGNLAQLLEREGDMQALVGDSQQLHEQSQQFLKQSKQMKSCCHADCSLV